MDLFLPNNVFTRLINRRLQGINVYFVPAAMVAKKIRETSGSAGFIPTSDLITNRELFVSQSNGISFEGNLCNAYIYYLSKDSALKEMNILGDISTLEILLSKIFLKEMYNADIEVKIWRENNGRNKGNFIVVGDENFKDDKFVDGISFSEEIIETLNLPFVNYVVASTEADVIKQVNEHLKGVSNFIYDKIEENDFGKDLSGTSKNYIIENIPSFILDFEENDIEGIKQLIQLLYFHRIIDDIFDINFV